MDGPSKQRCNISLSWKVLQETEALAFFEPIYKLQRKWSVGNAAPGVIFLVFYETLQYETEMSSKSGAL